MRTALDILLAFVALYPVVTAALWIAGGLMFRLWEERPSDREREPEGGWPGVSVLIPAYNEEAVIATSVRAALNSDYPQLEVLVLDDGSTDTTEAAAIKAAAGDGRFRVLRDPVNRGKAEQLNVGFARARHGLVIHRRRHAHAPARDPVSRRTDRVHAGAGGRGGRAARHQSRCSDLRDAGARSGGDHRADPAHPVAHRPGRRRRRSARRVPPRSRAGCRRL